MGMDFGTADLIRRRILDENDPVTAATLLAGLFDSDPDFYGALHGTEIAPGIHIQNPGPDAAVMTERYVTGVQATASRYVQGMRNPRRNPVEAAIRAKGKWANRVQEAIHNNLYEAGVRGQNYPEAVEIATGDGGAAFVAGAVKRENKVARVFQRLAPLLGAVSQSIQNMPQDTDGQREQRLLAARRAMIAVGKQMKGARGGAGG